MMNILSNTIWQLPRRSKPRPKPRPTPSVDHMTPDELADLPPWHEKPTSTR